MATIVKKNRYREVLLKLALTPRHDIIMMITSLTSFGSYKWTKPEETLFLDDDAPSSSSCPSSSPSSSCAIPPEWIALRLVKKVRYNLDSSIFTFQLPFQLPAGSKQLGLPVGGFMLVRAPQCEHDGSDAIRPYTSVSENIEDGTFDVLCKRYDQWGQKESIKTHFLFTRTDHSYRPAGACSSYIHSLSIGQTLEFKHIKQCRGRIPYPFVGVSTLTMIAVGANK